MIARPHISSGSPKLYCDGNEGRLVYRNGRVLSFMEFGARDGLPVFGFHGTPGSRLMFKLSHEPAARLGLRVIAPERPGYGLSSFQERRNLADWAADMRDLADALRIDQYAVAGVSGGGPYAAACAALTPERVSAIALVSPVGPMRQPEGAAKIGAGHHATFRLFPGVNPAIQTIFALGRLAFLNAPLPIYGFILSRAARSDWPILTRRDVRINLLEGVAEGFRPGTRGAIEEMRIFSRAWSLPFNAIRAPCFLWQGTADRNVPVPAAFRLGELIPGCRVSRLEGAGHFWIFDHMDEVLGQVAQAMRIPAAHSAASA